MPEGLAVAATALGIFALRVVGVALGTVRVLLTNRGLELWSAVLGFAEVLVYVVAIGAVVRDLTDWPALLAYCSGFSVGTIVGIRIERRLAVGYVNVRAVSPPPGPRGGRGPPRRGVRGHPQLGRRARRPGGHHPYAGTAEARRPGDGARAAGGPRCLPRGGRGAGRRSGLAPGRRRGRPASASGRGAAFQPCHQPPEERRECLHLRGGEG